MYTHKISEQQLKENKEFDFRLVMNKRDNLKIDIVILIQIFKVILEIV